MKNLTILLADVMHFMNDHCMDADVELKHLDAYKARKTMKDLYASCDVNYLQVVSA